MNFVITIWQDGTWKIWGRGDAYYASNDPDWLLNIDLAEEGICRKK